MVQFPLSINFSVPYARVWWLSLSKVARNAIKSSDNYLRCMFRLIGPNILIATICVLIVHGRKSWLVIQEWYQSTSFVENEFSRYFSSNYCVSIPNSEVNLVFCLTRITWIGYMIVQSSFMQDGVSTFVQMIWLDRKSTNHISWPIPCRRKSNCTRVKNPRSALHVACRPQVRRPREGQQLAAAYLFRL